MAADFAGIGHSLRGEQNAKLTASVAAKLLIDFYLSAEGQQALAKAGKIPLRRGVKSPSPDIDVLLESGNFHVVRAENDYSRYMKFYNEVLGIR